MGRATRPPIGPVVALLFLIPPALAESSGAPVLRYTVRADPFGVELTLPDGTTDTTRPEREATHFYFVADSVWPVPAGPDAKRVRCEIRWNGFPTDWRLVNSFGIDRRTQKFQTTLGELRKAVFAGGDFRVARSKKGLVLVTRDRWKFADAVALDLLDRIAEAHTAVWRDRGLAGHIVYLLGTDKSAGHWEGEARTRSMVLQASRQTAAPEDVAFGFAHELFHEWNSRRLNRSDDERLYWFTEGVTDYYATMTLWRAGIWDFERILEAFNTAARLYFGSPVRNDTADRMVERRKSDMNAERLPYLQGYLLASHWNTDGQILDQGMRKLLKTNGEALSNQRIAAALEAAGVRNVSSEIARFVTRGETIELRPRIWGDCATESPLGVKQFDAGFDVDESRKTGTIRGVRETSNAWNAGVREGQRWAPLDVVWGDPAYLAELEIRDGQGARRVKFYPASSDTVDAPQYTAIPAHSCVFGSRLSPSSR
jgi:predicted metalloprotease with PDZ domain